MRVLAWRFAVVVAYCQTPGWDSFGDEVDNFNETACWCDLLAKKLGLPEQHALPLRCGPVLSLLNVAIPEARASSISLTLIAKKLLL